MESQVPGHLGHLALCVLQNSQVRTQTPLSPSITMTQEYPILHDLLPLYLYYHAFVYVLSHLLYLICKA